MKTAAMMMLLATGTPDWAQGARDGATTLSVYVLRDVDDRKLNVSWAQTIASQIFAEAGVNIKWKMGEPTRGKSETPIVIDITSNTPKTLAPGALACAQVFEGVHIRVFWDRVQNTVSGANPLGTFLLAHIMAHEITHILQGINRHSETGVMKASWTQTEIEQMATKPLSLAPEDVELIHLGLLKRATRPVAGKADCR